MILTDQAIRRPITVLMASMAVAVFGLVAFFRLPLNLLPNITYPSLTVETDYAGAAPTEMENLVSKPVEEAVGVTPGVRRMRSLSTAGRSQVTLEFNWNTSMDFALLEVRKKLDLLRLPDEVSRPRVLRYDPTLDPVMRLELSGAGDLMNLRRQAEQVVKKELESVEGVAAAKIYGGLEEEIQIEVDERKLAAMEMNISQLSQRLREENVNVAGGSLYEWEARYLVRTVSEFTGPEEMAALVMSETSGRKVRLGDVAEVRRGFKERDVIARLNGKEAVEIAVFKEGDANTVQMARRVRESLKEIRKKIAADSQLEIGFDQATFIENAINEVIGSAVIGGVIAVGLLYLFLRRFSLTLLVGVSIPVSVIITFFFMYQMGVSLNVMSLGGLALGVGMLVDNSIVVLESISRHLHMGKDSVEAARQGSAEVGRAVIASTLTTVAVFLPIVFVEGVAGQLFKDQAMTVTFSLMASLVVALTLIPTLVARGGPKERWREDHDRLSPPSMDSRWHSVRLAKAFLWKSAVAWPGRLWERGGAVSRRLSGKGETFFTPLLDGFQRLYDSGEKRYLALLETALANRGRVVALSLGLFLASVAGLFWLGGSLVPSVSQGAFTVKLKMPEGTAIEGTDAVALRLQQILSARPEVGMAFGTSGQQQSESYSGESSAEHIAQVNVSMRDKTDAGAEERAMGAVREALGGIPNVEYEMYRPSYFSYRMPIEVEIFGDDLAQLRPAAAELAHELASVHGLADVTSSLEEGAPEVQIHFDRAALAQYGLDLSEVSNLLKSKIRGEVATALRRADKDVDVRVRVSRDFRARAADVENLIVGQRDGVPILLKAVAELKIGQGPSEIRRLDQRRSAVVTANLSGRDLGSVSRDIRPVLERFNSHGQFLAALSGQNREMLESFASLFFAALLAVFLVYLVMASEFESFLHPFVILLSVPLGLAGAVAALVLTGTSMDVMVLIGLVMLAGIVVNNAIVLIDFTNQLREGGMTRREALVQAGRTRLRPILMTTGTTVLGLLPMALGIGEGAELRAPLAITVIGGLTGATLLTLVVIPVIYDLLDRKPSGGAR